MFCVYSNNWAKYEQMFCVLATIELNMNKCSVSITTSEINIIQNLTLLLRIRLRMSKQLPAHLNQGLQTFILNLVFHFHFTIRTSGLYSLLEVWTVWNNHNWTQRAVNQKIEMHFFLDFHKSITWCLTSNC